MTEVPGGLPQVPLDDLRQGQEEDVDLRSDKQDIHADVHPHQTDDDGGQGAIYGKAVEIIQINREDPGEHGPADAGEQRSRELLPKLQLLIRQEGVDQLEEKSEKGP